MVRDTWFVERGLWDVVRGSWNVIRGSEPVIGDWLRVLDRASVNRGRIPVA